MPLPSGLLYPSSDLLPGGGALLDGEWQLDYAGTTLKWGQSVVGGTYAVYNRIYPDLGDTPITTEDSERPRKDGMVFGVDYFGGRTVTFELAVVAPTEALALTAQSAVAKAWQADPVRSSPGTLATLITRNAGRERIMFGRPRRFAPAHDIKRKSGIVTIQCDFACVDHLFYGMSEQSTIIPFAPSPVSGFVVPFTVPLSTVGTSTSWSSITIGGEQAVWPVMTVTGPISNPTITTGVWSLRLNLTLGAGTSITIDTRPGAQSVTRVGDGASFAGYLSRDSRIDRASLEPGTYSITLGGVDASGTSRLTVNWRETYSSI